MSIYGTARDGSPPDPPRDRDDAPPGAHGSAGDGSQHPGPVWPAGQPGAAGPVLGGPPPPATHPAPNVGAVAAARPPTAPARSAPQTSAAAPPALEQQAAGSPAVIGAQPDTLATTRLPSGGQETSTAARQAGSTILMAGTQQAATSAGATGTVTAPPRAATGPAAPPVVEHGTVYTGGNMPGHDGGGGNIQRGVRPLGPLRIGAHLASATALDQVRVVGSGMGLLLGQDRDKSPVHVRLFRPEPTRTTLIGGLWAAQIVMFRALALGARIVVFTSQPESWEGFGPWATGRTDRVAIMPTERPVTVAASARVPALLIYDVGLLGASNRPTLGPWQTQLTILRQLTAYGFPAVQESNLVMLQRLSPEEAFSAGSVLRLNRQASQLLQVLRDDMFALIGGGANRYVWVSTTSVENRQFGAARR